MKKLLLLFFGVGSLSIGLSQCPTASFTTTAPECKNQNISFNNTSGTTGGGWNYFWDFDLGGTGNVSPQTSNSQNPNGIQYNNSGIYSVSFTISGNGCPSTTATMIVTIEKARADFGMSGTQICLGESITYTNTGTSQGTGGNSTVTHLWDFGSGATPATSTQEFPPPVTYSTTGAKNITHYVTVDYPSCGKTKFDQVSQTIFVNPKPSVNFSSTAPVCQGSDVDFSYTGTTSASDQFSWDFGSNASPALSSAMNPNGISYSTSGSKTISLLVTNQYGCYSTFTNSININSLPSINAGNDTTICNNTSIQIGETNNPNLTYSWFPSNGIVINDAAVSNPTVSPVSPNTQFILTAMDNSTGCVQNDSIIVTMLAPLVADAGIDVEICRYDSIQIGASLVESQIYSWTSTTGISNSNSPNPMASPDSTITYLLTVTNNYNCPSITDEVTITVHQLPEANAGLDDSITTNNSTQLVATGGIQYTWSPNVGLSNAGIYNPIAAPITTTQYIVEVIDIYGCIQTDTVNIIVIKPSFWIPTAFTPDGDLHNDILYVRGDGINNFNFTIYDSWGHLIFRSENLSSGWDGNYMNTGEQAVKGAYVYHISGETSDGTVIDEKGLVNLIR